MKVRVEVDSNCFTDFGELTPDREAVIVEYLRLIRELLESTGGVPPRAVQVHRGEPPGYALEDENWRIAWNVIKTGGLLRGRSITIQLTQVSLKSRPRTSL